MNNLVMAEGHTHTDGNPLFDQGGPLKDPFERQIIFSVLDSFFQYRKNHHYNITHRRRQNLYALPSSQWQLLAQPPISILDTLSAIDDAIDDNADLAEDLLRLGLSSFDLDDQPSKDSSLNWHGSATPNDITKAHSTIRQFYRDWSQEGYRDEIEPLVRLVASDLTVHLPVICESSATSSAPSLLLPGAGLGRLLFELCLRGYNATGNEISYHQLLASNFILNSTHSSGQYALYPFVTAFSNVISRSHQLQRVAIPDIHPATAIRSRLESGFRVGEMNMTAGDFVLSYSNPDSRETFDGVVSVFFIDTAPNLIRYIETVRNCLKQGGTWINIGPLLWHFDGRLQSDGTENAQRSGQDQVHFQDSSATPGLSTQPATQTLAMPDKGVGEPGSFELSSDEVVHLISQFGFEVVKHEILDQAPGTHDSFGYMQDPTSLLQSRYRCSHWVARKL